MSAVLQSDPRLYAYREEGPRENRLWDRRYLLFLQDITAVFDGFTALDIADLGIAHNELRVVVGPNGAGKTTMCDVISGMTRPTTGTVWFDEVAPVEAAILLLAVVSLNTGPSGLSLADLLDGISEQEYRILVLLRLPRILLAIIAGAALGVSGALMQTLFGLTDLRITCGRQ